MPDLNGPVGRTDFRIPNWIDFASGGGDRMRRGPDRIRSVRPHRSIHQPRVLPHWSFQFRSPEQSHLGYWVIVIPVIGGLIVGLMAKYGSDKIKGHGIPEAMEAVLTSRSRIEAKVAILKPLSAAIAIGTGGPFGAEGPIIQTGGAVGSLIGQVISTTAAERKALLAAGAAAGMAATFNTPIAGVILAIELLAIRIPRAVIYSSGDREHAGNERAGICCWASTRCFRSAT